MSGGPHYVARVNFYHEAVGTRNEGETFQVTDSHAVQQLEQMGYIQKADAEVHGAQMTAHQEQQAKQQEYGQAQAKANETAGMAAHEQNVQANQRTQDLAQAQQAYAKNASVTQTTADAAINADKAHEYMPSATTNAETKAQVAQVKAAKASKVAETHENK